MEIKNSIKHYKTMLSETKDFATQTWIELQLIELRKELKYLRAENKTK